MIDDLSGNNQFSVIKPFAFWTQHVLPLVYGDEISYMETLDKVVKILNELIKNNNHLPEYIQQIVEEYITSGALEIVIREVLANFMLNVKYPPSGLKPAVGDGTADDTEAIQGCINYASAKGYGAVYFPSGQYLTSNIVMKNNVSLYAFDRYSTSLVLKGGATQPLISGNVSNISISNFTIKGNAGIQVNDITLIQLTGMNTLFNNLVIGDGYKLLDYTGNGGHLQMYDIVFGTCVTNALTLKGSCTAQVENLIFDYLSAVGGIDVFNVALNNGYFKFTSLATCPVCLTVTGNNNVFDCKIDGAQKNVADSGQNNNVNVRGKSDTTFMSGDKSETIGGNLVKVIAGMVTETITGDKTVSIANLVEKVAGDKTTTAGDISQTSDNLTVEVKEDILETTGGNKTEQITGNKGVTISGDMTETVTGTKTDNAKDIVLNTTNPLTYKTPTALSKYFKSVKFKDSTGDIYDVLVNNGVTDLENILGANIVVESTSMDMLSDTKLIGGMTVLTKGYHSVGDGGSCVYNIRGKIAGDVDNGYVRFISNNLVADPVEFGEVNVKCWGAYGDNEHDDYTALQGFFTYIISEFKTPFVPDGEYMFSKTITLSGMGGRNYDFGTAVFTYTGTDYAFLITRNRMADVVMFGNVNALTGGCFHIQSIDTTTHVQYMNLWFGRLGAKTKCIWVECKGGWCNEIRFKGGSFSGGAEIGCHLDCTTVVPPDGEINSIVFDTVGVEGVTTGFLFESADGATSRGTVKGITINEPRAWESYTNFLQTRNRVTGVFVNSSFMVNNENVYKALSGGASQIIFNVPYYIAVSNYGGTVYRTIIAKGIRQYGKITIDSLPPFTAGGSLTLDLGNYLFHEDNLAGISYIGTLNANAGGVISATSSSVFMFILKKVGTSKTFSVTPVFPVTPVTDPPTAPQWTVASSGTNITFTSTKATSGISLSLAPLSETGN